MAERSMIPHSAVVAIDLTQHPYHGKKADEIARGGPSKGPFFRRGAARARNTRRFWGAPWPPWPLEKSRF